jgi:hypothetical protein
LHRCTGGVEQRDRLNIDKSLSLEKIREIAVELKARIVACGRDHPVPRLTDRAIALGRALAELWRALMLPPESASVRFASTQTRCTTGTRAVGKLFVVPAGALCHCRFRKGLIA